MHKNITKLDMGNQELNYLYQILYSNCSTLYINLHVDTVASVCYFALLSSSSVSIHIYISLLYKYTTLAFLSSNGKHVSSTYLFLLKMLLFLSWFYFCSEFFASYLIIFPFTKLTRLQPRLLILLSVLSPEPFDFCTLYRV